MPHKYYHGRTGRIWNVTKRAVGVEINKVHRQRQIVKRIHVRMEHLRPSKSAAGHLARIKSNEAIKKAAKLSGVPAPSLRSATRARLRSTPSPPCRTSSGRSSGRLTTAAGWHKPLLSAYKYRSCR